MLWGRDYEYCSVDVRLRLKEVKELAQHHTVTQRQNQESNVGNLTPKPVLFFYYN